MRNHTLLALTLAVTATAGSADDWPQYNGPDHDRTSPARIAVRKFPDSGPTRSWTVEANTGFSSFAVAGERVFTLVRRTIGGSEQEACIALSAETGKELWDAALGAADYDRGGDSGADGNKGGDGPRSTPSVHGDAVYVLDASLVLHCLDAKNGSSRWRKDVVEEHGGRMIKWGNAACPLVDGGLVFVAGGGEGESLLAFDADTGEVQWGTGDERMTHATPVAATIHGVRQVIFFVQSGLVAVEPATGRELWRAEYPYRTSTAASPVVFDDVVYCSAGYGVGAGAFQISKDGDELSAELLWQKRNKLMNHWSTPVCKDGYLYGMFSFKKYGEGPLACVELATGDTLWSEEGFGPGNCILVGDDIVALGDAGQLVIVEATPEEYREVARAEVLDGKCWSSPAFAEGRVYLRSTSEAVCLDLSGGEIR